MWSGHIIFTAKYLEKNIIALSPKMAPSKKFVAGEIDFIINDKVKNHSLGCYDDNTHNIII